MAATLDFLTTSGSASMRIADIASAAGVSQVTIYNYFGSKETLVREVFIAYVRKTIDEFAEFLQGEHTLKEKIEYIIFQKKKSSRTFGLQVIKKMWQEQEQDVELAAFMKDEYMTKGMPLVVKLIEDGKKSGEISEKLSTSTIMMHMQMLTNQTDMIFAYAEQHGNVDSLIEEMVHLFFYGISS
ncbi:TetR/AcrR family transcriptional regulator [Paenibacillus roseipurpureus]|uniref:TetR/AcrR family transcriptional regulator n=1 Tax=Paenibacillus roseopurpureus TaxID=2918901 RepID=A0AA96LR53_9BACL|nr:TetR/AcrR family transcriptional regulator [Paenibacillus sp. MBLB1832]WNR43270.1 TetR/AcrR family transcriptional regulator [Paenibacillus sp. MBLB1832]